MPRELKKYSVRLYEEDVDEINSHFYDIGYNKVLRHLAAKLAQRIREGRENALKDIEGEIADG